MCVCFDLGAHCLDLFVCGAELWNYYYYCEMVGIKSMKYLTNFAMTSTTEDMGGPPGFHRQTLNGEKKIVKRIFTIWFLALDSRYRNDRNDVVRAFRPSGQNYLMACTLWVPECSEAHTHTGRRARVSQSVGIRNGVNGNGHWTRFVGRGHITERCSHRLQYGLL